jgi:putative aldouronate transport system substrate-binding protein
MGKFFRILFFAGCLVLAVASFAFAAGQTGTETTSAMAPGFQTTGYPIVTEPVTVSIAGQKGSNVKMAYDDLLMAKEVFEKTNVTIDWDMYDPSSWIEKRNLMIATNDLPDAFMNSKLTDAEIIQYGSEGMIIPLNDLIDEYGLNYKRIIAEVPAYGAGNTFPDGNIYVFARFVQSTQNLVNSSMSINREWLNAVGMEAPTNTEEFFDVLMEFKGKDLNGNGKNDEIPLGFVGGSGAEGHRELYGSFGVIVKGAHNLFVQDGKVSFAPAHEGFKQGVQYFRRLYDNGLIDQEAFTHDRNTYIAKAKNDVYGVVNAWARYHFAKDWDKPEVAYDFLAPLEGPEGYQWWWKTTSTESVGRGNGMIITNVAEHPEVLTRWADYLYEEKPSVQNWAGFIGYNLQWNNDGTFIQTKPRKENSQFAHGCPMYISESIAARLQPGTVQIEKGKRLALYSQYFYEESYPQIIFSLEDAETISKRSTDLNAYWERKEAEWIYEGGIEEEWDEYLAQLDKLGVPELLDIFQRNLDSYKAKDYGKGR